VLYEARSPWVLDSVTPARSLLLQFPRQLLPLRGNEITDGIALGIEPSAPAMRLLTGYLGQLFQLAEDISAGQRQDAARAALASSRPVADIAFDVGFTDLRTFERAFRRQFDTTPARWRRDHG
jgi:hypothetical protein